MQINPQLKLKDFQKETVEFGKRVPYSVFALQMGLGKSVCAIITAVETNSKCLIICPSFLKNTWVNEIRKFTHEAQISVFSSAEEIYKPWDTDFCIISYSFLDEPTTILPTDKKKKLVAFNKSIERVFEWADMVIFDESHYLKNMDSKRTQAAHKLVYENSIKRCIQLSGTPIENRIYELYSSLALVNYNPEIVESKFLTEFPTWIHFANHFSNLQEYQVRNRRGNWITKQRWEGIENKEQLKEIMNDCFIVYKTADVLDLKPIEYIDVQVDYQDWPELYDEFENFVSGEDESVGKLQLKAKAALMTAPFTVEYCKNLMESVGKILIYTDHVESCKYIADKFGVKPITGEMTDIQRQRLVETFQNSDDGPPLVATMGALSTGVTLTKANHMVLNDPPYKPSTLDQTVYRMQRIGQTKTCFVHKIHGTLQSEKIYTLVGRKRETINMIL